MSAALAALTLAVAASISERQHAPMDGWAAQEGGTHGGALAAPADVTTVRDRPQLLAALGKPATARIVRVAAAIDMSEGRPFADGADQARRAVVRIPSNTTLIGVAPGAGFVNASLVVANASQVIIRNLALRNPCDVAPRWDPHDGARGNWNAAYDAISVSASRHVWIDHNSFTDAPLTDDLLAVEHGMTRQCHDGALDITNGSDFVSVSYNRFALHQKNILVGGSDRATGDAGRLRVSFKANLFEHVAERAPRVRYGQVHLLNNFHVGDRSHPVYRHGYSVGVAFGARVRSDANAYRVAGADRCAHIVRKFEATAGNPGTYADAGSLLNGAPLRDCPFSAEADWRVPYPFAPLPAADVPRHVLDHAGPRALVAAGAVEARLVPDPAGAAFVLKARRDRDGNWQGASVRAIEGGATLQVELLEARAGVTTRLKQVRRRAPLPGTPVVLRFEAGDGRLSAWLDGEPVTTALAAPLPATLPVEWDGAASDMRGLRDAHAGIAPERIGMRLASTLLRMQAGDPPERIALGDGPRRTLGVSGVSGVSGVPGAAAAGALQGADLIVTAQAPGRTVVTVAGADPWSQVTFAVDVGAPFAGPARTKLAGVRPAPAHGERGVPPDAPLVLAFGSAPALSGEGSVRVVRRRDGALAALVRPGEAVLALGPAGRQRIVRADPIAVDGKLLRVRLPVRLEYDTDYEAIVEPRLVRDARFKGARWSFRTTPHRPAGDSVTVDDDSRADFRTVQGALDHAMTLPRAQPFTIHVRPGVYPELLYLRGKDSVMLRGASRETTVVRASNSDARNPGSGAGQDNGAAGILGGRALFLAEDSDLLEVRDIALHNTTRRDSVHSAQAEALFFSHHGGRLVLRNAHLASEQDTLQVSGYAWIHRSLIEGNVDFIWGYNRAALFEESEIRSVGDSANPAYGGYLVQARTVARGDPGFVFLRSRLTQGPGPAGNRPPGASVRLARSPGTANTWDNVVFIDCTVDAHVARDGWLRKPAPNPLHADAAAGWREAGNRAPGGEPLDFGGHRLEGDDLRRLSSRARIFAGFDKGKGWDPGP